MKHALLLTTTALGFMSLSCLSIAEVISVELPVTAVKVHPSSAVITREKSIRFPAGEHQLEIKGLPKGIQPSQLRLSIQSDRITLGSIDIAQSHKGDLINDKERRLLNERRALEDKKQELNDAKATAQAKLDLIQSLSKGGNNSTMKPSINGSEFTTLLSSVESGSRSAREAIRDANIAIRSLNQDLAQNQYALNQVKTEQVVTSTATANLRISEETTTSTALVYSHKNAYWEWLYEARLDTDSKTISLFRQANVVQNTGEDWKDINLMLTTANSQVENTTPELNSLYADFDGANYSYEREKKGAIAVANDTIEEVVVTGSYIKTDPAEVVASQYLVEFKIPGATTIYSGGRDKILPIDEQNFGIDLIARTVPEEDPSAFLEARFTYARELPVQQAEMQLYRDNAFIGETELAAMLPGDDIRIPFGVDERIRIEKRTGQENSRDGGVIRRSNIRENKTRYEITSFHDKNVPIEVVSRVPVSKNSKIEVDILDDATPATENSLNGKAGILMWARDLKPQQKEIIQHYFSVTYPKDAELEFSNGEYWYDD
ncbi:mucoidy inhibitor MuiA family protein [Aurantivibrio plasticivorans]